MFLSQTSFYLDAPIIVENEKSLIHVPIDTVVVVSASWPIFAPVTVTLEWDHGSAFWCCSSAAQKSMYRHSRAGISFLRGVDVASSADEDGDTS